MTNTYFITILQYLRGKPHPWGFKVWGRADSGGILYDFDVYQGGDGTRTELGQGADVVLQLTSTLPPFCNYKIYADNLFTGVPLLTKLLEKGMLYTGTVRQNRMSGCQLKDEKTMKKEGRGSIDFNIEEVNNIAAIRWYDNKAVSLLSTHKAIQPIGEASRWDKKKKSQIKVPMPAVVRDYNQHMGGIDLMDGFLSRFRFNMKSRRWYLYLFWHFTMVCLVNAWNIYRRDCRLLLIPSKQIMRRRKFQAAVAASLIAVNAAKRGRPSASGDAATPEPPQKTKMAPYSDIRYDGYCHWPSKAEKRGRCRLCQRNLTNTTCSKCDVRLCFVEERNCFTAYHQK